jgi:hypothetical protein
MRSGQRPKGVRVNAGVQFGSVADVILGVENEADRMTPWTSEVTATLERLSRQVSFSSLGLAPRECGGEGERPYAGARGCFDCRFGQVGAAPAGLLRFQVVQDTCNG